MNIFGYQGMYLVYVVIQSIPLVLMAVYIIYLLEKLREKDEIINNLLK